jgi:signal transduction histidine kinase
MDYSFFLSPLWAISAFAFALIAAMAWGAQYRLSKKNDVTRGLLAHFAENGVAIALYHPTNGTIAHAEGMASFFDISTRSSFTSLDEILTHFAETERKTLRTFLDAPINDHNMTEAVILKTTHGAALECQVSEIKWKNRMLRMLVMRRVTNAYRRMLAVKAENDALKVEAEWHTSVLNYVQQPMWVRGEDLSIRYCNLPYMQIIEENDEAIGGNAMPELFVGAKRLAEQARSEQNTQRQRYRLIVGGDRRLFEITEIYIPVSQTTVGVAQEITELEKAEAAISDHLTTLEDLLDSSSSAMVIYGLDTRLKFYNQAYVRMWGLEESWLAKEPTFGETLEYMRELRRLPEQVNFPAFKQQRLRLFNEVTEPHEELFYLPDGRTIRNVAIPHSAGGVLFIYEDVTDKLALERSYNTLIAVQRETLDNLYEGVVVFSENGKLRLKNPVFLSLWDLEEKDLPDGTHVSKMLDKTKHLYVTSDWELFKQDFIGQMQSRAYFTSRIERSDGAVLDCSVVPLPDGGVLLNYVDMTATTLVERSLRERAEALEAGDKLKKEFLANMSYELRSPLTSISGFAEMLRQDYFGELSEKQREYVEGIYGSSQHLMHLINDILDLSSIEAGYLTLNRREFNVGKLLHAMMGLLGERLREFELTARIDCPDDIGTMKADETRIRQVLFHLLSNAVKYSREAGIIILGAKRSAEGITLWVEDNGIGISEIEQKDVFDKFYRGSSGVRKAGSGLGLSMVKSFVELHGGTVTLESQMDKGTIVRCFIPHYVEAIKKDVTLSNKRSFIESEADSFHFASSDRLH